LGAIWLGHNAITDYLERADAGFLRLNLLLLAVVAFLPFPTRLFADFICENKPERVAANIYGISLLVASALLLTLWRYAVHLAGTPGCERRGGPAADQAPHTRPGGQTGPDHCRALAPIVASVGYLAVALYFIIPFRSIFRLHRARPPRP